MAGKHLATYLNDHLAGSELALELLGHLAREHPEAPVGHLAVELRDEIAADRRALEALMAHLEIPQSLPRKATAWLAEKMTLLKLRLDDPAEGALRLLETVEAISLGIEGKRSLWKALESASDVNLALRTADYPALQARAEDQRRRVEAFRLEAAKTAFASAPVAEKG